MAWVLLFVAAVFEIGWAVGLKYTHGFTRFWPSVLTIGAMAISLTLLSFAVRTIPVGTGYAVWTGIGAVGTAILGIVLFAEPVTAWRVGCLVLILCGIVGLKASVPEPTAPADEQPTADAVTPGTPAAPPRGTSPPGR